MDNGDHSAEPDLSLAGLTIWVSGYQFAEVNDYWDGNWLFARAQVTAPGARVETLGPFIRVDDFARFLNELERVDRDLRGNAELKSLEPHLHVELLGRSVGHYVMRVEITPDHMSQKHEFRFEIDQTFFKLTISQCRRLLERFPLRGTPPADNL
jgi:hypothetical protein